MPDRATPRPLFGLGLLLVLAAGAFHRAIALPELWRDLLFGIGITLLVGEIARLVFPTKLGNPRK